MNARNPHISLPSMFALSALLGATHARPRWDKSREQGASIRGTTRIYEGRRYRLTRSPLAARFK